MVCLHTGASAGPRCRHRRPPFELLPTLFPVNALIAAADWLWAGVPLRFPGLNVAMSEGGIGWVPMLLDRVDYVLEHSASGTEIVGVALGPPPSEVLQRNFWFCTIDDPSVIDLRHRIGVDHIMVESDYPHADSTWPDTQAVLRERRSGISRRRAAHDRRRQRRPAVPPPAAGATTDWRTDRSGR